VHDILASLREAIKSHEKSVGSDFPSVLRLSFVFKVGVLEFAANIQSKLQFVMRLIILDR